jgi:hypothetical protein
MITVSFEGDYQSLWRQLPALCYLCLVGVEPLAVRVLITTVCYTTKVLLVLLSVPDGQNCQEDDAPLDVLTKCQYSC